uniref:WAP domain-containing protein n=1 Tax=Sinocyclocheilus anshuiensis TaxID=1608454 RepID=A0A671PBE6_9TELE
QLAFRAFSDLLSLSCVCVTEKPGVCPSKNLGEEGLCVEMCSHDSNCPNDQKCCSNGCGHHTKCGRECTPPFKGICYICFGPQHARMFFFFLYGFLFIF